MTEAAWENRLLDRLEAGQYSRWIALVILHAMTIWSWMSIIELRVEQFVRFGF